ncbi:glycine oxidase ThiO [Bradymonas sediminis]|uniref:Glycine oxidase ThiO n=1 Tax=Bradymonas sediminis TaxID=1548548 RepID=A0A2Z4FQC3_9DELT|nr:glycine oxidase ThiO [Bradymonas sediminis]AWV91153.1 glycine oxidase ThiO [Bradymonas sediminis]TDP73712.1 glycine oxidase [Bradymonas sediminis]
MIQSTEFAIIGAGVAGLSIGWRLAKSGIKVTIFERDAAGQGASRAAAGMLAPSSEVAFEEDALLHLGLKSLALYPDFVAELEQDAGISVDYRDEGTLLIGLDADDAIALEHTHDYRVKCGLGAEKLDAQQARELEPGLDPNLQSALYIASDHQVDPLRLTQAMAQAFKRAGGQLIENCAIESVDCQGDKVRALRTAAGDRVVCDNLLIAAGAWTRSIKGIPRGVLPRVRPVRGQMLSVALGEPAICRHVIRAPDAYLVPKSDGRLLIGGTMEERGFNPSPTAGGVFELLRGAWETMPGIYDHDLLDIWTGFRPVSIDNLPVLGPTPVDGLWLACGHGRNGILLTPITALGVADAILGGAVPEDLRGFTSARFTI